MTHSVEIRKLGYSEYLGDFVIIVQSLKSGLEQYLFPDFKIRPKARYLSPAGSSQTYVHGYYKSREEAQRILDHFQIYIQESDMCDLTQIPAAIVSSVIDVLTDWNNNDRVYTAHDVTIEVRKRLGNAISIPHHNVRDTVHELFRRPSSSFFANYKSAISKTLNPILPPVVYFPAGKSEDDYGEKAVSPPNKTPVAGSFTGIVVR